MIAVLRICCALVLLCVAAHAETSRFEFRDGDRVVFLGGGFFERDLRYGYIETFLTTRFHDKNLTFRNLAWSGDTVFGDARAGFDSAKEGYERLKTRIVEAKPTVIFLQTGQNESFDGESMLPQYLDGLSRLLTDLESTGARIVLLSPTLLENLGPPLPDPTAQNENVRRYASALKQVATERNYFFVDLARPLDSGFNSGSTLHTDNGLHFTEYGYWKLGQEIVAALGHPLPMSMKPTEQPFQLDREVFFSPHMPLSAPPAARSAALHQVLQFEGLADGNYKLVHESGGIASASALEWNTGVSLATAPEVIQVEELRKVIIEKNRLFFNQWRPQNETYIFGFRKYEQGRFQEETPQFDPLIAELEKRISELRVPKSHTYRLVQEQ